MSETKVNTIGMDPSAADLTEQQRASAVKDYDMWVGPYVSQLPTELGPEGNVVRTVIAANLMGQLGHSVAAFFYAKSKPKA